MYKQNHYSTYLQTIVFYECQTRSVTVGNGENLSTFERKYGDVAMENGKYWTKTNREVY